MSGNIDDLYNQSSNIKDIHIYIPEEAIQRGKTILIEKNNLLNTKTDDYQNKKTKHLNKNQFITRDHLQSTSIFKFYLNKLTFFYLFKDMIEVTIQLPPEFFLQGQTITINKEDPQVFAANSPYRRQSKPDVPVRN